MLHSLFLYFQSEFECLKSAVRGEKFTTLQTLLLDRTRAIENQNLTGLQNAYHALFAELKKQKSIAAKNHKSYLKKRTVLLREIELERKIISGQANLAEYSAKLAGLTEEINQFDANIDLRFLQKLEECLQLEQNGFSQHSLFAFFNQAHDSAAQPDSTRALQPDSARAVKPDSARVVKPDSARAVIPRLVRGIQN